MMHVASVNNVHFAYDQAPVLTAINLDVAEGEFLGIVGPNAGGKSTLLKLLMGLLKPLQGEVKLMGGMPEFNKHHIGYVPQYPSFDRQFPITVKQMVLTGCLQQGDWFARYDKKNQLAANAALSEVEAEHLVDFPIASLSGGQLQRVMLARALVSEPKLLILDEPTANIDQRSEYNIFDWLKRLNERMTIVVVSHDIAFISNYVGRVACLNQTLVCHKTGDIDLHDISQLYGEHVSPILHHH